MQENFIGIRGVDEQSLSGLWVNDLPGVTLRNAANTANEEDVQGAELLKRCRKLAYMETVDDFVAVLSRDVSFGGNTLATCVGKPTEYTRTLDGSISLSILADCGDQFSDLFIGSIQVIAATDGCVDLTIDGVTEVWRLKKGRNVKTVNKWFSIRSFDVSIAGTGIDLYEWTGSYCNCAECDYSGSRLFTVEIFDRCNINLVAERYLENLKFAFWYKTGINLMHEILSTTRFNDFVRGTDTAERNLVVWAGGTDIQAGLSVKGQYGEKIKAAATVAAMDLKTTHSRCLDCGNKVVHVIP